MKERFGRLIQNNYIRCFVLGALAYYLFLSCSQMAGGKYILLGGDTLDGTVPMYWNLCENLLNGKAISYTWGMELGINSFINLANGMFLNISMPFYLLLHNIDYSVVTIIILVVKAGLTSVGFYLYIDKIWNVKGVRGIIFSLCYTMCAYWIIYVPIMLIYVDAIYMLPLILYLVTIYANKGKFRLMCLAYLYLFLNFFYTGYMVGFFSLFYLVAYMLFYKRYSIQKLVGKLCFFGICIIITAGMTGAVLYPMAYFLASKYTVNKPDLTEGLSIHIWDIYNQLFIGQTAGIFTSCPYIYCGIPVLMMILLYFFERRIQKSEKKVFLFLVLLMLVSCIIYPLYLFWHCLDVPDGDPFRFSFIISFILCVIAARMSMYITDIKTNKLVLIIVLNAVLYIVCMYVQPIYQKKYQSYPDNNWKYLAINLVFMLGYIFWLCVYRKVRSNSEHLKAMKLLIVMIVLTELILNGYVSYYKKPELNPTNNEDIYRLWRKTEREALESIKTNDSGFYRISAKDDFIINSPMYFNYPGIATFSNMENYEVRCALEHLGIMTTTRVIFCNGLTDFTRMLLSTKYEIQNVKFDLRNEYVTDFEQHATVTSNEQVLALGFLANEDIQQFSFAGRDQFSNINDLASCLIGEKHTLYDTDITSAEINEDGIQVVQMEDDSYAMALSDTEKGSGSIHFRIAQDERPAFIQFDYGTSDMDMQAPILADVNTGEYDVYERLTTSFIKNMTKTPDGYDATVFMTEGLYKEMKMPDVYFAYYNRDEFIQVYEKLKQGQMNVIDYDNGYVLGQIHVSEDHKTLFTSIPYDEGWEISVNGEKREPVPLLDGAFIGLPLEKGDYEIEFHYHVPGLSMGIMITLISFLFLLLLFFFGAKRKVKAAEMQQQRSN